MNPSSVAKNHWAWLVQILGVSGFGLVLDSWNTGWMWALHIGIVLGWFAWAEMARKGWHVPAAKACRNLSFLVLLAVPTATFIWGGMSGLPVYVAVFRALTMVAIVWVLYQPKNDDRAMCMQTVSSHLLFIMLFVLTLPPQNNGVYWAAMVFLMGCFLFNAFFINEYYAGIGVVPLKAMLAAVSVTAIGVMAIALVVALPLALFAQWWKDKEFPSIGGLPGISTSAEPVMAAQFEGKAPSRPYWRLEGAYVMMVNQYQWLSLEGWGRWSNQIKENESTYPLSNEGFVTGDESHVYKYTQTMSPKSGATVFEQAGKLTTFYASEIGLEGTYSAKRGEKGGRSILAYQDPRYLILRDFTPAKNAVYLSLPLSVANKQAAKSIQENKVDRQGISVMPKTWALVQSWKKEGLNDRQMAVRALSYFQENLAYHFDHQSTDPAKNGVDYFLFEDKKGVCRHFANAYAVMMRMAGIRSRIVGGFQGGDFDEKTNTWTVRRRDAHAWTEIWLEGEGWVRVDPTSVVPVEKGIPNTGKTILKGWVSRALGGWKANESFSTSGTTLEATGGAPKGLPWFARWLQRPELFPLALLLLGVVGGWWALRGFRSSPRAGRVPQEERQWQALKAELENQGVRIKPSQGPSTVGRLFAPSLPPELLERWRQDVADYERWRFGGIASAHLARRLKMWRQRLARQRRKKTRKFF